MGLSYVGSINLGVLSPLSLSVAGALTASLQADIQLLVDLIVSMGITPPTIAASITVAIDLIANLTLAVNVGLPYVDVQVTLLLSLIAELTAELALCLPFSLLLAANATAGIFSYAYNGTGAAFGAATTLALGSWPDGASGSVASNALIIATVSPSVWADVEAFFSIIPPSLPSGLTYFSNANLNLLCGLAVESTGNVIADLNARLNGALALSASLTLHPPTLSGSLDAVIALLASLEAALELGLPGVSFQLEAVAKAKAALEAQLSLLFEFTASMSGGGAYVYTYSGPGNGLGAALTSELATSWPGGAGSDLPANALVLGTTSGATWTAMSSFFGGI